MRGQARWTSTPLPEPVRRQAASPDRQPPRTAGPSSEFQPQPSPPFASNARARQPCDAQVTRAGLSRPRFYLPALRPHSPAGFRCACHASSLNPSSSFPPKREPRRTFLLARRPDPRLRGDDEGRGGKSTTAMRRLTRSLCAPPSSYASSARNKIHSSPLKEPSPPPGTRRLRYDARAASWTRLSGVSTCGSSSASPPGAYHKYSGTPAAPWAVRKRVIAGSRRVQSPTIATTPAFSNASLCASRSIATLSLTLQVRHQSAVNHTNTGFPDARASASVASLYGIGSRRDSSISFRSAAIGATINSPNANSPTSPREIRVLSWPLAWRRPM